LSSPEFATARLVRLFHPELQVSARVLIIESGSNAPESSCQSALSTAFCCERREWETLRRDMITDSNAALILPCVVPETPKALAFFQWLGETPAHVPTLAILPESPSPELLTASQAADDVLFWPVRGNELEFRIQRLLQLPSRISHKIENDLGKELGLANLVGAHPSILRAARQAVLFAGTNAPLLITGETGTGKELFAHATHALSSRKHGPFIPVDCASLPEHLAENELFGHCRGAFTDAHKDQRGLAALAENGTLFLDEVDALSATNQAKLLRFLQEGTFRALGAERFTRSNARVIAASNHSIEDRVQQGKFRSDLYFRLNVLRLHLPALRERRGDILLLAQHFLENECGGGPGRKRFSVPAMRKLESHHWPGNARELFNIVQRASVCSKGAMILPGDIMLANETTVESNVVSGESFQRARRQALEQFERDYVEQLLNRHEGNVTQAAREAGKERRAFGKLVKKYNLGLRLRHNL
jgi:DNA-binding NtrC family response regulator